MNPHIKLNIFLDLIYFTKNRNLKLKNIFYLNLFHKKCVVELHMHT